jgi:hypothetical protein
LVAVRIHDDGISVTGKGSLVSRLVDGAHRDEVREMQRSKFAKTLDHTSGVRVEARFAIMEVLNHIIGWITDEWLWVDHKPRLSLGPQNVSRVKIGGEKCVCRCWFPERLEDL